MPHVCPSRNCTFNYVLFMRCSKISMQSSSCTKKKMRSQIKENKQLIEWLTAHLTTPKYTQCKISDTLNDIHNNEYDFRQWISLYRHTCGPFTTFKNKDSNFRENLLVFVCFIKM